MYCGEFSCKTTTLLGIIVGHNFPKLQSSVIMLIRSAFTVERNELKINLRDFFFIPMNRMSDWISTRLSIALQNNAVDINVC